MPSKQNQAELLTQSALRNLLSHWVGETLVAATGPLGKVVWRYFTETGYEIRPLLASNIERTLTVLDIEFNGGRIRKYCQPRRVNFFQAELQRHFVEPFLAEQTDRSAVREIIRHETAITLRRWRKLPGPTAALEHLPKKELINLSLTGPAAKFNTVIMSMIEPVLSDGDQFSTYKQLLEYRDLAGAVTRHFLQLDLASREKVHRQVELVRKESERSETSIAPSGDESAWAQSEDAPWKIALRFGEPWQAQSPIHEWSPQFSGELLQTIDQLESLHQLINENSAQHGRTRPINASHWQTVVDRFGELGRDTVQAGSCLEVLTAENGAAWSRHHIDLIMRRSRELKTPTAEQKELAYSPNLLRGPKVIRGVAGSGKSMVLALAAANRLYTWQKTGALQKRILVTCFNRPLASYLRSTIQHYFRRLGEQHGHAWVFPAAQIHIANVDQFAAALGREFALDYRPNASIKQRVSELLKHPGVTTRPFDHIFIDEAQDIDLQWYPLLNALAKRDSPDGRSLVIFYDEAQNLYGRGLPGRGGTPPWKHYLGDTPRPHGLKTVMRVGHRNTNEILSFSFGLLLGRFAPRDPQMKTFANMNELASLQVPGDYESNPHPFAGQPCVQLESANSEDESNNRAYQINFAQHCGPVPEVHSFPNRAAVIDALVTDLRELLQSIESSSAIGPHNVLLVTPTRDGYDQMSRALENAEIAWRSPHQSRADGHLGDGRDQAFFQSGKVTLSTIASAKGFTAHIVHVVFIEDLTQPGHRDLIREQQARAQIHVACTRSTLFVDLWGCDCPLIHEARQMQALLQERHRTSAISE